MLYRFLFTLGLLVLPVASVEAAYQQDYRIPRDVDETQDVQQDTDEETDMMPMIEGLDLQPVMVEDLLWDANTEKAVTRSVFTAHLIRNMYTQGQIDSCFWSIAPNHPPRFTLVFTDVHVDDPYAKEICIAMRDGIVRGYIDGSFGPDRALTFAESAKILSRAYALAPYAHADIHSPWYSGYVHALIAHNAVPLSITTLNEVITTGEAREMLDRLQNGITWKQGQTEEILFPPAPPRRPAVVAPVPTPSSSTSQSSSRATVSSTKTTVSAPASSSASQMPVSSKESFWDLF